MLTVRASRARSDTHRSYGVEMAIIDDQGNRLPAGEIGEIIIRGHGVMAGYHERPEATAESIDADGWFKTGDLAKTDEDGFFFIVDRKKELVIRGGYNVYPREIEEVLYEHPGIMEAAVIGLPHEELGEEVAAAVAAKPGHTLDADEVQAFVKERVAAYKYPRHIVILPELPKTATQDPQARDRPLGVRERLATSAGPAGPLRRRPASSCASERAAGGVRPAGFAGELVCRRIWRWARDLSTDSGPPPVCRRIWR